MILFLSVTGIFLSVILITFNAKSNRSSIYLGLFFFLLSLYALFEYVIVSSHSQQWVLVFLYLIPVFGTSFYLIGPLLFWYVRSVLTDNHRLYKSDLWHLVPALIFFLAAWPDLFVSMSVKAEAAAAIAQSAGAVSNYKPTYLSYLISFPALFLSRPLLLLAYTFAAIVMFIRFYFKRKNSTVFVNQTFVIKWMVVLLSSLFVLVSSYLLLLYNFTSSVFSMVFLLRTFQIISVSALIGLLLSPFFFPSILYGLPRLPEPDTASGAHNLLTMQDITKSEDAPRHFNTPTNEREKPSKTALKSSGNNSERQYLNQVNNQVVQCMQTLQPYLQQNFTLAHLSVLTKIPTHHLAYYFRGEKKQTFTDFRNEWRVEHAKKLIREGKSIDLTLEAIGLLSGFSSRNTFLNAFKKVEGISPQAFLLLDKKSKQNN